MTLMIFNPFYSPRSGTLPGVLLMTGHHRLLASAGAGMRGQSQPEHFPVLLASSASRMGRHWSNAAISLFIFLPATVRHTGIGFWRYLLRVYLPPLVTVLPICRRLLVRGHPELELPPDHSGYGRHWRRLPDCRLVHLPATT